VNGLIMYSHRHWHWHTGK